jgi:hypothetical protein
MKKIVIMPGGFHPFHAGHMALYNAAREAFPSADIFVAATDDTSDRPFPFKTKKFLAQQAGVPGNRFIRVKSPFRAEEITQMYDPNDTALIFVRSEKDAQKPPQAGGVKKDGSAAYLQPYKRNGLEPFSKHGYMAYLPTVQFGPGMTSATEIRAKWPEMSPEEKIDLVKVLYPSTNGKDAAAGKIVSMFDTTIGTSLNENSLSYGPGIEGYRDGTKAKENNQKFDEDAWYNSDYYENASFDDEAEEEYSRDRYEYAYQLGYQGKSLDENIQEIAPAVGAMLGGALARSAGTGAIGQLAGRAVGSSLASSLSKDDVEEAVLINDPDAGHLIQPDGGMGTWNEDSLKSNLAGKFSSMLQMLKSGDYDRLHYVLQKGEVVDRMVQALAEYQAFMKKQGRRPMARGREINMNDYLDEKKPMEETKSLSSFLAGTDAMVRAPANGARAEIFTAAQRAAIERFVPQARGQTDHELLQAGKEFLEKFLQRVKSGEELPRQDRRIVSGLYDIIRGQTDRYDNFVRQHNLDEN